MREEQKVESLEDLLDDFAAEEADDPGTLAEWVGRYPRYARELTEFALLRAVAEHGPEPVVTPEEDGAFMTRAMGILDGILAEQVPIPAEQAPIADLLDEAKARGLNARGLARKLRVPPTMVVRLRRRVIRFASIPQEILEGLANVLERNVASVVAYLNQAPTFAAGVSYKSEGVPTLAEPEDFYAALLADEDLDG
ncbi:MAG TPA: hypothetical protein VE913_23310, partial [Longimicrobium sp.]|nr:hypothetical protein [Longimicrobium sp.]